MESRPSVLTDKSSLFGLSLVGKYQFTRGNDVPLYEVSSVYALNQIIGHAKFRNQKYGNVYYRGVTDIFDNVMPSLMRGRRSGEAKDLCGLLNKLNDNEYFINKLKLEKPSRKTQKEQPSLASKINRNNKHILEAMLQHYAGKTRFLDVVDNHWVALWMGLHTCNSYGKGNKYLHYNKREIPIDSFVETSISSLGDAERESKLLHFQKNLYLYILLIAMPNMDVGHYNGVYESDEFVEVDLRTVLPSTFLRPHAQHALVVKRRDKKTAVEYDMASQVIGVLRVRIDHASEWLGNGELLTQSNLFPHPALDQGYDDLLLHSNDFTPQFEILKYF